MAMTFARLLKQLQTTHYPHSAKAFAVALGMHHSRIYRALQPGAAPFDVRGCLRLAKVTGADLLTILRAAGKGDIADGLEELLPQPLHTDSPARQRLHVVCDRLTEDQIRMVVDLVEVLTNTQEQRNHSNGPAPRTAARASAR